jgi:predicted RNA-binding protein with PUA-like domain
MKKTAIDLGVDHKKVSHHSLRIAGLVTLFAADVPDSLKQLAGRWADPKSFVIYARATMQQFTNIATALNNPQLVTVQHIKKFYQQHGQS